MTNDLQERIYDWVLRLLRYLQKVPRSTINDVITKQLIRSGTSVGANYVEAQGGYSRKDFTNFVQHSLKSAQESAYWLRLLTDVHREDRDLRELKAELSQLTKILASILIKVKSKK